MNLRSELWINPRLESGGSEAQLLVVCKLPGILSFCIKPCQVSWYSNFRNCN